MDGSGKVDYSYNWRLVNSFNMNLDSSSYQALRNCKTKGCLTGYWDGIPVVIDALPKQTPGAGEYRRALNGVVWSVIKSSKHTIHHEAEWNDEGEWEPAWDETTYDCRIKQYNVERIEDATDFDSKNYILDNLVVANVRTLNKLDIPAVNGVDAHGCEFKSRGATVSIGGRDYINDIQTDWGATENLCLYGNGISFDERVVECWEEYLANGVQCHWSTNRFTFTNSSGDSKWRGKAFSYKAGCGSYNANQGEWNPLPDESTVLEGIILWNSGEDWPTKVAQEIDIHTGVGGLDPDYIELGGFHVGNGTYEYRGPLGASDDGTYYADYTKVAGYDPHSQIYYLGVDLKDDGWKPGVIIETYPTSGGWYYFNSSVNKTKEDLRGIWDGYEDGTRICMTNWVLGQRWSSTESALTVYPFGK